MSYRRGCQVHGNYLHYARELRHSRGTAIIIVLCFMLPLGLFMNYHWVRSALHFDQPLNGFPKSLCKKHTGANEGWGRRKKYKIQPCENVAWRMRVLAWRVDLSEILFSRLRVKNAQTSWLAGWNAAIWLAKSAFPSTHTNARRVNCCHAREGCSWWQWVALTVMPWI